MTRQYLMWIAALWAASAPAQSGVSAQRTADGQTGVQARVSLDATRQPPLGQSAFSNVFGDIGTTRHYTISNINLDGRAPWRYPWGWNSSNFSYAWQYQNVWIPGYYVERWIPPVIERALVRGTAQTRVVQPGYYERQWIPGHYELQLRPVLVPYTIPYIRFKTGWNSPIPLSQQGAAIQHNARPGPGIPRVDSRRDAGARPAVNAPAFPPAFSHVTPNFPAAPAPLRTALTAPGESAVTPAGEGARFEGVLRR